MLNKKIKEFYEINKLFKTEFTWGITGTIDNLNYRNNTEPLGKLLKLNPYFWDSNVYDKLKDSFV